MQSIITRIKEHRHPPTRADIAELLAGIGAPGEELAEKAAAVTKLYEETGHRAHNIQGLHVTEILDSFPEY